MGEKTGYLVLSTGDILEGKWLGKIHASEGELVFNTSMTGYQEVMTDPSYAGQIVGMTYPLIGNYGFSEIDYESLNPALAGLIISHPCRTPEHYQSTLSLEDMINKYEIPCLFEIDTRKLTRIIRDHGEVYGRITSVMQDAPQQLKVDSEIVKRVSIQTTTQYKINSETHPHVVIYDFGCKHSIVRTLAELDCNVTVVPFDANPEAVKALHPDAIVLSNGPGDPEDLRYMTSNIREISESYPTLGICLGHQLVALAYGGKTKRLPYGHRGSNHPVKDLRTGKVVITSQNHGYAVDLDSNIMDDFQVSYMNVNDQTVEGLVHSHKPIMTVQFHPEAHPGPSDTQSIFQDFVSQIPVKGVKQYA
ncbi:carbamoyl phosphate synthase small subunit [Virgibacillus oceani]|uniref:Carbamoyl phosphate synthase small chain n=1 Tax=Virgibacillus oceani TaxID=1479511 RepID=A0A917M0W1_9BACI|nr:carbamoyl phosphate synthase small subunit [Virgibacillus oceani]GGG72026.1 carbamoyl-phosphate synthase small chain [Virgibacillus oceani]